MNLPVTPVCIYITDEIETHRLLASTETGVWGTGDVSVCLEPSRNGGTAIKLSAPQKAVRRVRIVWPYEVPAGARILGDHFERGYGDLEWRGIVPERILPWYALIYDPAQNSTMAWGIETGASAFCTWRVDGENMTLDLDVSCGGSGVQLKHRTLTAGIVHTYRTEPSETPFAAAHSFCRHLCPRPRLPRFPVYGANDWYYAYGNSSAEQILRDTDLLVAHAPDGPNRPFMVIDDGWQVGRGSSDWRETQRGPWDKGNARFPDMPGLAQTIRAKGARPGIWIRPLGAPPGTPENWLLPASRTNGATGGVPCLDPSLPENREQIRTDIARLREWGFELVKHDWTTCDALGRWGFEMHTGLTNSGWSFADNTRTSAEILRDLYEAIRDGAGTDDASALLIGCNTVGHLGAGLFEIQRTGDDTSGKDWERTRKMGVNTLAFRMPQHSTFFAADADCVGLTNDVPWPLNRQWLDLLARSGTPLFVSADPNAVGPAQSAALREAFACAALPQLPGEPLDWQNTTCPRQWRFGSEEHKYNWSSV